MTDQIGKRSLFLTINIFKAVPFLFKVAISFGLVFNICFTAAPILPYSTLGIIVHAYSVQKRDIQPYYAICQALYLIRHSTFNSIFLGIFGLAINGTEDTIMPSRIFWFMIFSVLGAFLYMRMSKFCLFSAMTYYMIDERKEKPLQFLKNPCVSDVSLEQGNLLLLL